MELRENDCRFGHTLRLGKILKDRYWSTPNNISHIPISSTPKLHSGYSADMYLDNVQRVMEELQEEREDVDVEFSVCLLAGT